MVTSHLLTGKALRYRVSDITLEEVPGTTYDAVHGFWRMTEDGQPLIKSEQRRQAVRVTKKFDVETGEDQKGQ